MTASSTWQVLSGTVGLSIDATQAKDAGGHEPHDHPGGHLTIEPDGRKLNKPWAARESRRGSPFYGEGLPFKKESPKARCMCWNTSHGVLGSRCSAPPAAP